MKIPLFKPWTGEEEAEAAAKVIKSEWLIIGPVVKEFENEFAKTMQAKHAVAVNSGSSALLVSLMALGIKAGDEVIVPDMTFVSTASSALLLGAKPVFADINLSNYCINYEDIEKRITKKTKAIVPVHYAGQSADMHEIMDIARKNNLFVLEDAAQAHATQYKGHYVGTIGDLGIFSFTPPKLMTTGEGGMIVTNNDGLAEKCRLVRNYYETTKFNWEGLGFNFRMNDVLASIGLVQLKKLPEAVKKRKYVAKLYSDLINSEYVIKPLERNSFDANHALYTIRLDRRCPVKRDEFILKMQDNGISTRLYYPTLHHQKVFSSITNGTDRDFPNATEFRETAVSLPIYSTITELEVRYVCDKINNILKINK